MTNARELLFDLEALLNEAQPRSILWLGEPQAAVLESYLAHCKLLNIEIEVAHFPHHELGELQHLQRRFDLGIALDIFPYLDKPVGVQLISRLRDLMCQQFCLNISTSELDESYDWHLTDLIGLGLRKVADYPASNTSLFKYSIDSYKRTPDWLNADNWANPELWGKYRW